MSIFSKPSSLHFARQRTSGRQHLYWDIFEKQTPDMISEGSRMNHVKMSAASHALSSPLNSGAPKVTPSATIEHTLVSKLQRRGAGSDRELTDKGNHAGAEVDAQVGRPSEVESQGVDCPMHWHNLHFWLEFCRMLRGRPGSASYRPRASHDPEAPLVGEASGKSWRRGWRGDWGWGS